MMRPPAYRPDPSPEPSWENLRFGIACGIAAVIFTYAVMRLAGYW